MRTSLDPYLEHLRALPSVKRVRALASSDGTRETIEIATASGSHTFEIAELRSHLGEAEAERTIDRLKRRRAHPPLLLAPYVSRPMGERLRQAGIYYLDQAGNLSLQAGARGGAQIVALVEGRKPVRAHPVERAWRAPSYQVLFAVLAQPSLLGSTVREIARAANVSTTPVLQVKEKLVHHGFAVLRKGKLLWTPSGREQARDFWQRGYQATLRPHLLVGAFRPRTMHEPAELEAELSRVLRGKQDFRWGGAAAAHRLDGYYRGDRTVVHIQGARPTVSAMSSVLRMLPDPAGPVVVLSSPGPLAWTSPDPSTVRPLLVWAELLEEAHDRASEAAAHLVEHVLDKDGASAD